jgi:hypothetical protein
LIEHLLNIYRKEKCFKLDRSISRQTIDILVNHGLRERAPQHFGELQQQRSEAQKMEADFLSEQQAQMKATMESDEPQLIVAVERHLVEGLLERFPSVHPVI